jgi:hypothetical protein
MASQPKETRKERNSETVFVRMKPSTRLLLERRAEEEDKTLSEAARSLIENALQGKSQEAAA